MGVEESVPEPEEKIEEKPKRTKKRKSPVLQSKKEKKAAKESLTLAEETEDPSEEPAETEEPAEKIRKIEIEESPEDEPKSEPQAGIKTEEEIKWFEPEGQLAIDIYQTNNELVIQSAIAGVKIENLDIALEKDVITIKGKREKPFEETGDFFAQECYWGAFSREIILPAEIDPDKVKAKMMDGVLTIRLPKILREKKRRIVVTA